MDQLIYTVRGIENKIDGVVHTYLLKWNFMDHKITGSDEYE